MIALVTGTMGAAFCIWLTVRICNRRERRAIMLAEGLVAGSVLVVLGSQAAPELRGSWWSAVCAIEFSPDGSTLAAGLYDGKSYNEDFHYRIRDLSQIRAGPKNCLTSSKWISERCPAIWIVYRSSPSVTGYECPCILLVFPRRPRSTKRSRLAMDCNLVNRLASN